MDLKKLLIILTSASLLLLFNNCSKKGTDATQISTPAPAYTLALDFTRVDQAGLDPFDVKVHLKADGTYLSDQTLTLSVPKGSVSNVTDNGDGTYTFRVTPSATGEHPVTVSFGGTSVKRTALVFSTLGTGVGQPLAIPGDYVNSAGYEDGATITPDGQYFFVQYGPVYFAGIIGHASICNSGSYSMYDVLTCDGRTNSGFVFNTIGSYADPTRPNFPTGKISAAGKLMHINITVPGVANGLVLFPTVFYGFKKQTDGTFAEPFKVAFNDANGAQGPFGLSFQMTGANTAKFAFAWNDYFNGLGDDKPDIYQSSITLGQDTNLGNVTYSGEAFASITPNVTPVSFTSHAGVQGNPHLYYDFNGDIKSIWVDDEQVSHNLNVYRLTAGSYPTGTWTVQTPGTTINTAGEESQPFFTGTKLYLNRDTRIVSHDYIGSGHADYNLNASWGAETVILAGTGTTAVGEIYGVGEPTIATVDGKKYLYFIYVFSRGSSGAVTDFDLNAGFVEVP